MQRLNKTTALLRKVSSKELFPEAGLLKDPGLLELFSWHTTRSPRARLKDTLQQLIKQELVHTGEINKERIYSITAKGKARLALDQARTTSPRDHQIWTGRWHLVTYQIPDTHKAARNQFLVELKRLGYKRYSPALWIYPHDVASAVQSIAKHLGLTPYVQTLRADVLSNQSTWQKAFGLTPRK